MGFIVALVFGVIGLAVAAAGFGVYLVRKPKVRYSDELFWPMTFGLIGSTVLGIAAIATAFMSFYTQDAGEVVVIRGLGGDIVGSTDEAGFHAKAPQNSTISYSTRNNVVSFIDNGESYVKDGSVNGTHVTVNDNGGASADVDIQVNYSLRPDYAEQLYQDYGTQESFVQSVVAVDVRSVTRGCAGRFSTIDILTNRQDLSDSIEKTLSDMWEDYGLNVEQVSIQEVKYPESITNAYADAQKAEAERQTALNKQETAKVEAETKKIEAQGTADANKVLNDSLTDRVLTQKYIDALKGAKQLVVVPDGSQPIIKTE